MLAVRAASPSLSLSAAWQPLGPNRVASPVYGNLTGRVTAVAIDPADATGNTVYLGTTGGGVWKSTNAAGPSGSVSFVPLTDTLPVFSANSGTSVIPSLSIGAISVDNGVVLAGTGDPNDAADSYYGDGLLRSADGGTTWTLIQQTQDGPLASSHSFLGVGVAGFAWSTAVPNTVVAAISDAAEGDLVNAPDPTSAGGLYYSPDAGVTWKMATIMDGSQTVQTANSVGQAGNPATAVVWNPVRQRFYAAVRFHGYYESGDGVTWTRLAAQPGAGLTLAACPTNPGTTGSLGCPIFRGALAVQPVTGDIFALTTDLSNRNQGLWQDVCALSGSACAGAVSFGHQLNTATLEQGNGSTAIPQADYNLALAAVATGSGTSTPDTLLFVGTADLYRCSLASGCTLRNTTNATNGCAAPAGVAGAQHAIATLSTTALPLVYLGNDGGVWRSTDGVNQQATPCSPDDATHFQNLNGGLGSLAEVVSFAQNPRDANTLLVGLGANGSAGTTAAGGGGGWAQLSAGEGGTVAIDQVNPLNWYISTAGGVSIASCTNGGACAASDFAQSLTIGLPQVSDDASLLDPPWLLDVDSPAEVVIGTCRVWRGPTDSVASWNPSNAISRLLSGPQGSKCALGSNSLIRSLGEGGAASGAAATQNAGATVLYAGMSGLLGGGSAAGHLFSTQAGATASSSTAWTDLAGSPVTNGGSFNPFSFDVSSVAVDSHDATGATVYATVMGFSGARLYRSTDAGAHWANISGNLPGAPANSVVVDPGDANTVYVALDTGVYVTQQVGTCATANCWTPYGVGLPNAPVVSLLTGANIAAPGGATGQLRAATYGRGIWQIPLLTAAVATTQPAMQLQPLALAFGSQAVGTLSASQTNTVTNTGSAPLTVSSVSVTGDFLQTNTCSSGTIAVGASCTVQVSFLPVATGARNGVLTVYGNVAGGQATAALSGNGTPASAVVLNPLQVRFAATTVGATTVAQNVTISNTGATAVTLASEVVTGDFKLTANTCGTQLAPGTGCTVAIVFSPAATGARTGLLTVTDSVGAQTAVLTGTGTAPATDALAPLSLTFAPQLLNTTSPAQAVTLTNAGDQALTLIAGQITSGDFTVVNGCGASLNGHASCSLLVAFVPKNVGAETGLLTVTDQFRAQTVMLNGVGVAPAGVTLSPVGGLSFGVQGVGLVTAAQTVTLTNNGGVPLAISGIAATGDFAVVAGSNTCGASLAVSAACTVQVAFTPTAAGGRGGALTVTDSAGNSPQTLSLSGTGIDFALTASNSTVTVASGTSAIYGLLLTPATAEPGSAVFTCTGAPSHATCLVVPASVPLGSGPVTATVTVATGVATASRASASRSVWLAWLLPLGLLLLPTWRGRNGLERLLCVAMLCGLVAGVGCGAARVIPVGTPTGPGSTTPTPPGGTTIVVSATSAGLTRTVNLSLIVQ